MCDVVTPKPIVDNMDLVQNSTGDPLAFPIPSSHTVQSYIEDLLGD